MEFSLTCGLQQNVLLGVGLAEPNRLLSRIADDKLCRRNDVQVRYRKVGNSGIVERAVPDLGRHVESMSGKVTEADVNGL